MRGTRKARVCAPRDGPETTRIARISRESRGLFGRSRSVWSLHLLGSMSAHHANPNDGEIRISDLMTRAVFTLTPLQSLPLAEAMMGLLHVRHVPVVDEERRLVGLVTHRDLLAAKISALTPLTPEERSTLELSVPVSRVMRTNVWTIGPDALAINAVRIMREHQFGCLPVVVDEKLVGIVTEADLLSLVTDALSLEKPIPHAAAAWTMERVMTRVPVTITADTPLSEARSVMSRYGIRHLPVLENGTPVSMVSERDLSVAEAIFKDTHRTPAAHVVHLLGRDRAYRVPSTASFDAVLHKMHRERLDAVLVVVAPKGTSPRSLHVEDHHAELAGIFTATDACRLLAEGIVNPHRA